MPPVQLRDMEDRDSAAVLEIYGQGIETGQATFETEIPPWETWLSGHLHRPRLVATDEQDRVLGWAAISPVSSRCVYGGVGESSVYVARTAWGQGVGRLLMERLVEESEAAGIWSLQAGIFPENGGSIRLHEAVGFRVVGVREGLGKMGDVWRDVVLMERRSSRVGRD